MRSDRARARSCEVGTFTDNVCKDARSAQPAAVQLLTMHGVGDRSVLAVPPEVPKVANLLFSIADAPLTQVPDTRCKPEGGNLPFRGSPTLCSQAVAVIEIGGEATALHIFTSSDKKIEKIYCQFS